MSENKYTYKAFISYSQDPDKAIAKMLEDRIERFDIGWHRLKKQKLFIFRDVTDLVPDKNLPEKIEEALSNAEFLIVLAQKKFYGNDFSWVNVEAEYFVKSCEKRGVDPTDHIILVVTDGEIAWDRIKNQWNFELTNVIPQSLRQIFKHEPLYVDLRPLNDESASKSQKNRVFRDALIAIVAKLLYKKPSEIQNQIIKLQRYVIGFIALVLVFISILSVYAKIQKDNAVQNSIIADENAEKERKQRIRADENAQIADENAEKERRQRLRADENAKIADENAEKERRQRIRADENAKIADENAEKERIQRIRADENAEKERIQRNIADTERAKTDTINKLIEAENLALKALDFYKSLDDTLVQNMSPEVDLLAQNQKDSIEKAFVRFKNYRGIQKEEHKNKLETLYTSRILSDIFFSESKIKLDTLFDMVYQTSENKTIVSNLQGQIYDIDNKQNVVDHIDNFVEVTPVFGTNLILYSNYKKNVKLFDIEKKQLYQIESKDILEKDVIISAFSEKEDILEINSKSGETYQIQFTEKQRSFIPEPVKSMPKLTSLKNEETFDFKSLESVLNTVNNTNTKLLNDISCYCIDMERGSLFIGNSEGEIKEYTFFDKKQEYTLASIKDRINKILFDKKNQILIVQVGANQLVMFARLEWGFTKIYQEILGNRIDDVYLGKNGNIYVLYDRNRLVFWPVQNDLFQHQERKFANK